MNFRLACFALGLALIACACGARADEAAPPQGAGILILGDSNAEGPFGGTLYDALRVRTDPVSSKPLAVSIFAKCGAGAIDWIDRERAVIDCGAWACSDGRSLEECHHFKGGSIPALSRLYSDLHAARRVTVVALGLNMIIGNREHRLADAANLIEAIHGQHSACIWVGPPQPGDLFVSPERFDSFVVELKRLVIAKGCRYVASDDKTDRNNLGLHSKDDHYSPEDARNWARLVLRELDHPARPAEPPLAALLAQPEQH